MERLTKYVDGEVQPNHAYKKVLSRDGTRMIDIQIGGRDICEKLAAYEDSGLTPAQVAELARTKAEGRLVVLPCVIGAPVW